MAEQGVGRGAAGRVFPEVNVDWRRPGRRQRSGNQIPIRSMNFSTIQIGDHFKVLRFTAIAKHVCDSSIYFEFAHVSQNGFTRTGFGHAAIMTGSQGEHDAIVLIAIPDEYQATETLSAIQRRLFDIVGLATDHSFVVYVSPRPFAEMHGPYADGYFRPIGG